MKRGRSFKPAGLVFVLLLVMLAGGLVWKTHAVLEQDRLNYALMDAINDNSTDAVMKALRQGADPNARNEPQEEGPFWSLLWSQLFGRNHSHTARPTNLLIALQKEKENGAVIQALLQHGANPNVDGPDGAPLLVAQEAGRLDIMRLLLDHGADANVEDASRTPLMWAAGWGDPEEVALLLSRGANVNAQDEDGRTALMYAVGNAREENVVPLLAYHANTHLKDKSGNTALSLAISDLASHAITSFHHGADDDDQVYWLRIVKRLKNAGAKK